MAVVKTSVKRDRGQLKATVCARPYTIVPFQAGTRGSASVSMWGQRTGGGKASTRDIFMIHFLGLQRRRWANSELRSAGSQAATISRRTGR